MVNFHIFLLYLKFFIKIIISIHVLEISTKANIDLRNKTNFEVLELPNSKVCNVDPFANMCPKDIAIRLNIKRQGNQYPFYKIFRSGTKYEYTTVQYDAEGQEFVLNPFTDAIRKPNGQLHEYQVSFDNQMTVIEYKKQRLVREIAVLDSCKK